MVSDLHGDRWEIVNPHSGRVTYTYDVDGNNTDLCRVHDDQHRFCLIYGSRHRVTADGHDEVAYTVTAVSDATASQDELRGRIIGIRPTDPGEVTWTVDRLDFSRVDPDQTICRRDPADPCLPAPDATDAEVHACDLYWPHDFHVLDEGDAGLELVVADTRNDRVLYLTLPPDGGTCATVTDVLDTRNPDWDIYASVNAVEAWQDGDKRELVMSAKDAAPGEEGADQVQGDGAGKGKIVRWEDDGTGWRQLWEHPPASTDTLSFVNAPHGLARDDGHLYYAHALGTGDTFDTSLGGSVGVLDLDGHYLYDAVPSGDPLLYARDAVPMGDGTLLVTDSGTKGDEKEPADTALSVLVLPDADPAPAPGTGAWSADHAQQTFLTLHTRSRSTPKDAWVLYSAEPITDVGAELGRR